MDEEMIEVKEGTVVRVAPEGLRTWRNNSQEDLYYIVIQAAANSLENWTASDGIRGDQPVGWSQS